MQLLRKRVNVNKPVNNIKTDTESLDILNWDVTINTPRTVPKRHGKIKAKLIYKGRTKP